MYNEACVPDHRYTCVAEGLFSILYFIGFLRNIISRCWEATEFSIKIARNEIVNLD